MDLFGVKRANEIRQLSTKLKIGAQRARTFAPYGEGDEQTNGYEIEKYTPIPSIPSFQRGLMFVTRKNESRLSIVSAHETDEPINAGPYEHQRDLAIQYATQEGVRYSEIDHDKISEVLTERRRV